MAKNNGKSIITVKDTARVMKAIRKKLEMTQADVAKAMGVSQGTLSKMESAKAEPTVTQWYAFCRHTGSTVDSLLRGEIKK